MVISVRNVGYVKSAGEIMKKLYDDIGSAGGHRAMAKAVVPLDRFKERFGEVSEKVIREAMLPMIVDRDQIELVLIIPHFSCQFHLSSAAALPAAAFLTSPASQD